LKAIWLAHSVTLTDAQTKETLTLRISSFGSKCDVSDAKFLKKLEQCGITELVNAFATFKNEKELKKTDGAKRQRITGETPCHAHLELMDVLHREDLLSSVKGECHVWLRLP